MRGRVQTQNQLPSQTPWIDQEEEDSHGDNFIHKSSVVRPSRRKRKPKMDEEFVYHGSEEDDVIDTPKTKPKTKSKLRVQPLTRKSVPNRKRGSKKVEEEDGEFLLEDGGEEEEDELEYGEGEQEASGEEEQFQESGEYRTRLRSNSVRKNMDEYEDEEDIIEDDHHWETLQRRPQTRSQKGKIL